MRIQVTTRNEGHYGASFLLRDPKSGSLVLPFGLSVRSAENLIADLTSAVLEHERRRDALDEAARHEGEIRQTVSQIHHGAELSRYTTEELRAARLYCGGAEATTRPKIEAELERRDDRRRRAAALDERRDYAEERANAELLREE